MKENETFEGFFFFFFFWIKLCPFYPTNNWVGLGSIRVGGFGWTNRFGRTNGFGLTLPSLVRGDRFDLRGERDFK